MDYRIEELEAWDAKIREIAADFGLDPFPQVFELCDYNQMIAYMAYSGMPSRYPHWSFGKQYEKQRTMYDYGIAGLPYEMVINSNPCLAYLMADNSLLLQILTIAHVYAHNDFFRHNLSFKNTYPQYTLEKYKAHATRVRKYIENPHIGYEAVERVLDSAHALSLNCDRFAGDKKIHREDGAGRPGKPCVGKTGRSCDNGSNKGDDSELRPKIPTKPDQDILVFIRDHNPFLHDWEKDLLTIVHEEALYFIPQIETKIMNEGWASIWHKRILDALDLSDEMRMEFFVRHNQVLRPIPRSINPYYMGYKIFEDLERKVNEREGVDHEQDSSSDTPGRMAMFQVREIDRDESFLRRFLTREMMKELDLYAHEEKGRDRVVTKVSSEEDWKEVKNTLLKTTGMNSQPVIKVHDADFGERGHLFLVHEFDDRELESEYARKTLRHVHNLWGGPVTLETYLNKNKCHIVCRDADSDIEIKIA